MGGTGGWEICDRYAYSFIAGGAYRERFIAVTEDLLYLGVALYEASDVVKVRIAYAAVRGAGTPAGGDHVP